MPKLDLLCATIWGSGVVPGDFGGVPRITGCSKGLRGVLVDNREVPGGSRMAPGDSGGVPMVFRGIPGVFRWFRLGSGWLPGGFLILQTPD